MFQDALRHISPVWHRSTNLVAERGRSCGGAIKLARTATTRPNVIIFRGSFHGRKGCWRTPEPVASI